MYPEATVVGSKVCLQFLSNLMHQTFNQQAVKGGDKVGAQGGGGGGARGARVTETHPRTRRDTLLLLLLLPLPSVHRLTWGASTCWSL